MTEVEMTVKMIALESRIADLERKLEEVADDVGPQWFPQDGGEAGAKSAYCYDAGERITISTSTTGRYLWVNFAGAPKSAHWSDDYVYPFPDGWEIIDSEAFEYHSPRV